MIEAFRIGVQMTMDVTDIQSTVASVARDFTSLNQQISQSQSGLSAVRAGLIELAGQQKSLHQDQGIVSNTAIWQSMTGLPRTEPMVAMDPVAHSQEQGSAAGLAAPVASVGIAGTAGGFEPLRRSEAIAPDPAMAILPSLATLMSRSDSRFSTLPDVAAHGTFAPIGGEGAGGFESSGWSIANNGLPLGDRRLLDDLGDRLTGVSGTVTGHDFALDNTHISDFLKQARLEDHSEPDTLRVNDERSGVQPAGWADSNLDDGTASSLALAVAGFSSTATDAARLIAPISGGIAPVVAQDPFHPRIALPPVAETNVIRPGGTAQDVSKATDSADALDGGTAKEVPALVIHTDVHLDGHVIAQAVSQQIVDWMNGPLPGVGGFDPRRSYTPVES